MQVGMGRVLILGVPEVVVRVVVISVQVLVPGLCGPGRLPAARGRAFALRVEPPGVPASRPCRVSIPDATRSGRRSRLRHAAALSRARGSRALFPSRCAWARPAWRTDRLAGRCAALRSVRRRPDRHPGHPPSPEPGRWRPNTLRCSQRLARRASRCVWWHVGRSAAAAR